MTGAPLVVPMPEAGPERILWGIVAALMPVAISEMERRGGPSEADYAYSREIGFALAGSADVLIFGGQCKGGETKPRGGSGRIARALAPLAWREGGVMVAGLVFRAGQP